MRRAPTNCPTVRSSFKTAPFPLSPDLSRQGRGSKFNRPLLYHPLEISGVARSHGKSANHRDTGDSDLPLPWWEGRGEGGYALSWSCQCLRVTYPMVSAMNRPKLRMIALIDMSILIIIA